MKTYIKYKSIFNSIICVVFVTLIVMMAHITVYAASANVSISSSNVTKGDEFDVIVTIKADANIGAYNFYIDYDANVIEAVSGFEGGGNGRIQLMAYAQSTNVSKETTIKVKFKAKNPGTSALKYVSISDDNGVIDFDTADNMNVTSTEGSVTVKAPYVASTNNYLSSLKVEAVKSDGSTYSLDLSPAFSKDVTKYYAEAVEGVTKLVISATQEDSKASIKTSGTPMDPGDNTTSITVTAEDGSTRKYVIYTTVAKPPETTTTPPEPIIVQIDGTDSYIEDINNAVALPEGFETFEYEYNGKKVVAAKGLLKSLIVMYVTKGDGSAGQLYIYEEGTGTFYPMSNIQMTEKLYTIVKEPENLIIPEGFTETTVSVGEQSFKGWVNSEVENIYLIYAMNWNGASGLYYYDVNEEQIMRYFDVAVQAGVAVDEYNSIISENEKLKSEINQLKSDNTKEESGSVKLYKYLAIGSCIMAVIYLGIIIYLVVGRKGNEDTDAETENIEPEDAESENIEVETVESETVESENIEVETVESETAESENIELETAESEAIETEFIESETVESEIINSEVPELEKTESETIEIEVPEIDKTVSDVEADADEFIGFDDEQDEIDDMLMDFEDIITGETEAAIAKEESEDEEPGDKSEPEEIVEFAEEIKPDLTLIEEAVSEETITEETVTKETETEEVQQVDEETETERTAIEEEKEIEGTAIQEEAETKEEVPRMTSEEKKKKVEEIMEDKDSSINAEDIDMVIDELFDDLFG